MFFFFVKNKGKYLVSEAKQFHFKIKSVFEKF